MRLRRLEERSKALKEARPQDVQAISRLKGDIRKREARERQNG
jgi:hypothetical protein